MMIMSKRAIPMDIDEYNKISKKINIEFSGKKT